VRALARYVGERDDCDFGGFPAAPVVLESYTTVDLAAELDVVRASPGATLTVRGENLFGADVRDAFNFPARGETLWVGVRVGHK
jgi:outer membrane cobalamin receptor